MLPGLKRRVVNFHDVLMYVALARKHLRLMLLLLCFSWLAGLVYYVYARPVFFSRALVKIDPIDQPISGDKEFGDPYRIGGIANELISPHMMERVASKLGVKADYRAITKDYIKKISPKQNSEKNLEVDLYPYSFDWAKRWNETMVTEYIAYRRERRMAEWHQRQETYARDQEEKMKLIEADRERLIKLRGELKTEEAKIEFDKLATVQNDLVEVERRLDEVTQAEVRVTDPDLSVIEKLSLIAGVTERPLKLGVVTTLPDGDNKADPKIEVITPEIAKASVAWQELNTKLHTLEVQKEEMATEFLPGHSKMVAIQTEIEAVKRSLDGELRSALTRLDAFSRNLIEKNRQLRAKLPEYQKALINYTAKIEQLNFVKDSMVPWTRSLTSQMKDHVKDEFALPRDRVAITYGGILQINDTPVSPNRFSLLLYTTILGILLALGIPFLIEYLDHTLSNLEQVESAFQLRGLGIVPKLEADENSIGLLRRDENRENNLLENFRVIRTNLLSMGSLSKPPHVLMITSAMPKEGKTVVSSNLALSFAQTGAKTLLLDTDLRRGRLHRLFGYRKQPGLSGVLLGQIGLDEAIRPTPHENLSVLSTGQHLETGTELLGSQKFKDIMAELRQRFDRIVVDTPPVLGLSETSVLQSEMDGVLFVIWSGHTPIKGVRAAIEMLQGNGANFYGFVLNRLDLSATANYYQYYYYSHDYYYHYSPRALENA
jgi:polysaccharide biosynthesis transport protein